jgi:hypothetical protein
LPVKNLSHKKAPHIERSADRARSYKRNAPVFVRKGAVERAMVGHHSELQPMPLNLRKMDRIFPIGGRRRYWHDGNFEQWFARSLDAWQV